LTPDTTARFRPWLWLLALGLCGLLGFFLIHRAYYLSPLLEQAEDARHPGLRSSGRAGLVFGLAGTVLILMNLTYLVRRRLVHWRWPGSLRTWMDFHVASGLLAAACILLHSCLGVRSALGVVAIAAFGIVVLAGIIGRYLYAHVPRSIEGRELELDEVRSRFDHLLGHLRGLGVELKLEPPAEREQRLPRTRVRTFFALVFGSRAFRQQYRERRRHLLALDLAPETRGEALPALRRLFHVRQSLQRYHELRNLMASWRFLHRWLALVMIGTVVFHVALAVLYGNLWILGGRG